MLAIAWLTLHEALGRRVVAISALLGLVLVALTGWGFWKLHQDYAQHGRDPAVAAASLSVLVVMLAYMFSTALAVGAAFIAASSLAGDLESGVLLSIVPRPVRRSDVVLGKWLGLSALLGTFVFAIGGAELGVVAATAHYVPPHPLTALLYLAAESIVTLSLALLLATRLGTMSAGICAVAGFGLAWIAGICATIAASLGNASLLHAATAVSLLLPSDGLWRGALAALEPAVFVAAGATAEGGRTFGPFAVAGPPATAYLAWTATWVALAIWGASLSFGRRDV